MPKADANITVGADTTAFSKATDGLIKGVTEKLEKIGNVFMGAVGIGAGLRSLADSFSAFTAPAAELENVATSLGVVMGNAEAAERLTGSLERLATNGVVSFDELHRSARALTNVFQDDAVISHYVSRMADIAAGADIPASRLAELVARMEDVGKAELTELSNKGVPIYEALEEVMGKSRDEVVKLGNEGKVSCSAYLAALEKLTDEGGRYHQTNSKMSNTTKGSWDTLKASINECKAVLGEPMNDTLRPVLQDLATWIQNNKEEITAVGKGIVNVCTNVHLLTFALAVMGNRMLASVVSVGKIRAAMTALSLNLSAMRMQMGVQTTLWGTMWAGMVATTRAAVFAIKTALTSSGVGIAIWLLGEAVAWCVTKFGECEDAATDMGAAAQEAADATNKALAASKKEMEQKEAENRAERDRTRQMEEQARLAQEAADAEAERLKTVEGMARARRDAEFEKEMDALREVPDGLNGGERGVVRARLRRVGARSEAALYAERDRLEEQRSMTEEELRRYEEVAAAIGKIEEEHRKAAEAAAAHREENLRRRDNYYDRKSTDNQNRAEAAYEKKSIPAQEKQLRRDAQAAGYWGEMNPDKIREHLDELARTGAKDNERSIAALERILHLHDELVERKARYQQQRTADMQSLRVQALELAGRKRAADALREELAVQERITELREQGASKKQATEQAELESKLRQAQEQRQRIQSARVEFIQGHQANVGGGGVSFRLGNTQLQESKKHSRLLKEIRDYLRGQRNTTSGVAVLA